MEKLVSVPLIEALTRNPYLVPFSRSVATIVVSDVVPMREYEPFR